MISRSWALPASLLALAMLTDWSAGRAVGPGPARLHGADGESIYLDFAQVLAVHPSANAEATEHGMRRLTAIWTMGDPEPLEVREPLETIAAMMPNHVRFTMPETWVGGMGGPVPLLMNRVHVVSVQSSALREAGSARPSSFIRVTGGAEFLVDADPATVSRRLGG